MPDRYAYLSCCTEEERIDEGTQEEYLELEAVSCQTDNIKRYRVIKSIELLMDSEKNQFDILGDIFRMVEEIL